MGIKNIKGGNILILILATLAIVAVTTLAASIILLHRQPPVGEGELRLDEIEINNHIYEVYSNAIVHTKDCYCVEAKRVCED